MPKYGLGKGLASLIPSIDSSESTEERQVATVAREVRVRVQQEKQEKVLSHQSLSVAQQREETKQGAAATAVREPVRSLYVRPEPKTPYQEIPIEQIVTNPYQPRKRFEEQKLLELSQSIRVHGILEPLVVTQKDEKYELIAGERRLQAARLAELKHVPVIIRKQASSREKLELAVIENLQRANLNSIEKAKAFDQFTKEFKLTHEEVAKVMGKSRAYITNTMHLLDLPLEIQRGIEKGEITEGHGRAILMIKGSEKQRALFEQIKKQGLSVRDVERVVKDSKPAQKNVAAEKTLYDAKTQRYQETLEKTLGTKVIIQQKKKGGRIVIDYFTAEDLAGIYDKITRVE